MFSCPSFVVDISTRLNVFVIEALYKYITAKFTIFPLYSLIGVSDTRLSVR